MVGPDNPCGWKEITLQEALRLAGESEKRAHVHTYNGDRVAVAVFSDGLHLMWQSECHGSYSDDTPDLNWEPPTVWAIWLEPEDL